MQPDAQQLLPKHAYNKFRWDTYQVGYIFFFTGVRANSKIISLPAVLDRCSILVNLFCTTARASLYSRGTHSFHVYVNSEITFYR